jgi:hypothetical protein
MAGECRAARVRRKEPRSALAPAARLPGSCASRESCPYPRGLPWRGKC